MTGGLFITATNTGAGKTVVTAGLLRAAGRRGLRAVGLKLVASGSEPIGPASRLRNRDALELQAAAGMPLPYELVNPYCFEPPVAPHLAARAAGRPIALEALIDWYRAASQGADLALVEGAGGWRVPLHPAGFLSDLPEQLGLGVVLVVGLTLGCLNHARLTAEAILGAGRCPLVGWIANHVDPTFERAEENVETLARLLDGPPLAQVPHASLAVARSVFGNPIIDFEAGPRLWGQTPSV